jgi:hypothetical protein
MKHQMLCGCICMLFMDVAWLCNGAAILQVRSKHALHLLQVRSKAPVGVALLHYGNTASPVVL